MFNTLEQSPFQKYATSWVFLALRRMLYMCICVFVFFYLRVWLICVHGNFVFFCYFAMCSICVFCILSCGRTDGRTKVLQEVFADLKNITGLWRKYNGWYKFLSVGMGLFGWCMSAWMGIISQKLLSNKNWCIEIEARRVEVILCRKIAFIGSLLHSNYTITTLLRYTLTFVWFIYFLLNCATQVKSQLLTWAAKVLTKSGQR